MARPVALIAMAVAFDPGASLAKAQPQSRQAEPPVIARLMRPGPEYNLIRPMVGAWRVQQRVWTAPGAEPIVSPSYRATRRLIREVFLQEIMEAEASSAEPPFTRTAYLSFNNVNRRWEYVSMDSRFPRTMYETSYDGSVSPGGEITVLLDSFIMPGWGTELTGQSVKQRRTIRSEGPDRTVVRQFWTPPAGTEFLAIEYIYTRLGSTPPARASRR